ncbi:MAG: hypothetical protein WBB01_11765, partial [Phormidesmis sp.]
SVAPAPTPVTPGPASSIAPILDPSTTLELTVDANRPGSNTLALPNESMPAAERGVDMASPVQQAGMRADDSSNVGLPSAAATIPPLDDQEIVPINQGAPLQELRLIDDAPIMKGAMGEPQDQDDDHTPDGAEAPPAPNDNDVTEGGVTEGVAEEGTPLAEGGLEP